MKAENLYCQMFVDANVDVDEFEDVLSYLLGLSGDMMSIKSKILNIYIVMNDEFDSFKVASGPDAFLYYPYYLEVDPAPGVARDVYIGKVAQLLTSLRTRGWRAVPACDFEHELPWAPEAPRVEPPKRA